MVDPSIVAALNAALEKDESNCALRLHLANLLVDGGQPSEGLVHLTQLLAQQPANQEALALAAKAAELTGDMIRAHGYRTLKDALSWTQAKSMIEDIPEPEVPSAFITDTPSMSEMRADREGLLDRVPVGGGEVENGEEMFEILSPDVTLKDVAGLDDVKRRLNLAFLAPLRNPDMMKLYGRSLKGGLLLYGPPGCGKTFVARAVAGELGARFLSVGLSDVLDMWLGNSEKNLHEIFETARRNKPCVLFFDEIDALGKKRSLVRQGNSSGIVNQLLSEMDGINAQNDGVFILAATNHPWDVDTALRRPGRLDRTILVSPPDAAARAAIIEFNMVDRPHEGIDIAWIARQTDGYSGADMAHLCDSAAELAMEKSLQTGNALPISMTDFKRALKDVKPSTRAWLDDARNFAMFANEGGAYDDLVDYLRSKRLI